MKALLLLSLGKFINDICEVKLLIILSSSPKPGTHFLENNKIIGVHNVETLHEQRTISAVTLHDMTCATKNKAGALCFATGMMSKLTTSNLAQAMMLQRSKIHSI